MWMCLLPVPRGPLRHAAVTGGTQCRDTSGVYLAQHWLRAPGELQRPSFSATPGLANRDPNRTFTSDFLTRMSSSARANPDDPCKVTRARELNQLPGPQASGRAFGFVLDLHSSTANAGTCLIAEAAHRGSCHAPVPPPAHGKGSVDRPRTEAGDRASSAAGVWPPRFCARPGGEEIGKIAPPTGYRSARCHTLQPGIAILQMSGGEDVLCEWGGRSAVYPMVINKATYYEKGIASIQAEKLMFSVPALPRGASQPACTPGAGESV
ncbi:aspartoacylase-2 [Lynx pardinus]|uniref:Aspartoacylase-2 n=1 Tax=Lynx pardinus TaxID=191816 RepID=A0A485P4D3_LYNPA|nr:aspartoacylase-2 [Lynx pardinus]